MFNIGIIGCVLLWLVGILVGIVVFGLFGIFFFGVYFGLGLFF